jgi:protein-disulfide isomerase/uncharacterized membrane protein
VTSSFSRTVVWFLAVLACVGGLWLSRVLTFKHLEAKGFQPPDTSASWLDAMCSATATASCEEVAKSEYAVFPFHSKSGLPVSLLGMFYFTAVLVWLGLIGECSPSRWWVHLILVAGTTVGVGASAFFEFVMWTKLDHYCPQCVVVHVLSLLLMIFALLLWPRRAAETGGRVSRETAGSVSSRFGKASSEWPFVRILLATPIVALVAMWGEFIWLAPSMAVQRPADASRFASTKPADDKAAIAVLTSQPADALAKQIVDLRKKLETSEGAQKYYKQQSEHYEKNWRHSALDWDLTPATPIATDNRPFRGPANAPHTMVIYSDFQCPACKNFEDFVNTKLIPLSDRNGGLVRIIFKHWPICQDCNPDARVNLHPAACKASQAAEAARILGGDEAFWKMYDLLWKKQAELKKSQDFASLAKEIGLNEQALAKTMASDEVMARIKADIQEGTNLGKNVPEVKPDDLEFIRVTSTPAIFVDNKRIYRAHPTERLWLTIFGQPTRTTTTPKPAVSPGVAPPPGTVGPLIRALPATRPGR